MKLRVNASHLLKKIPFFSVVHDIVTSANDLMHDLHKTSE